MLNSYETIIKDNDNETFLLEKEKLENIYFNYYSTSTIEQR